jgi:proteasome regulatory subunit
MELVDAPTETYEDIGGLEKQIMEIREAVELPMTRPDLFEKIGITPPKGVLLYGPPGTGKTLLAKAVAHETHAIFLHTVGSELYKSTSVKEHDGQRTLELAKEKAPSIVFIDEIDAIGASRTEAMTSVIGKCNEPYATFGSMDGFEQRGDVKIIGATTVSISRCRPFVLEDLIGSLRYHCLTQKGGSLFSRSIPVR